MDLTQIYPPRSFAAVGAPLEMYSGDYVYRAPPVLPQADPWVPDAMRGAQAETWLRRAQYPWEGATMAATRSLNNGCYFPRQQDSPFVEDDEEEESYFTTRSQQ